MAHRVQARDLTVEEGNRLLRILARGSGNVVTWRRAQMVLLSAQGMPVARIAEVTFTSPDRVRDVIQNFDADGFDSLYPRYRGGRPPTFRPSSAPRSRTSRWGVPPTTVCRFRPGACRSWPSSWSRGGVDDIRHEGLRLLLRKEGVSFQRMKTWKRSNDPDYEAKKNRNLQLHAIADGIREASRANPPSCSASTYADTATMPRSWRLGLDGQGWLGCASA